MCLIKVKEIKSGPEVKQIPKKDGSGTFDVFCFECKARVDMQDHTDPRDGLAVVETTSKSIRDAIAKADETKFVAHRLNLPGGTVFSVKAQDNPRFQRSGGSRGKGFHGAGGPTNRQAALRMAYEHAKLYAASTGEIRDVPEILTDARQLLDWLEGPGGEAR